jgi:transcriptional regulator with PAS, ATPase and Fis domain
MSLDPAGKVPKSIHKIPHEVMEALKCHSWPGNVRELQNVIEFA